jgi:hypothetical protein
VGRDAGVGDHQIDPAGAGDPILHGGRIGDIDRGRGGFGPARPAKSGSLSKPRFVPAAQQKAPPRRGQRYRQRPPEAGGGAGDQAAGAELHRAPLIAA